MPALAEHTVTKPSRKAVDRLVPEKIRVQMSAAFAAGTHGTTDILDWLRNDRDHKGAYQSITYAQLDGWLKR